MTRGFRRWRGAARRGARRGAARGGPAGAPRGRGRVGRGRGHGAGATPAAGPGEPAPVDAFDRERVVERARDEFGRQHVVGRPVAKTCPSRSSIACVVLLGRSSRWCVTVTEAMAGCAVRSSSTVSSRCSRAATSRPVAGSSSSSRAGSRDQRAGDQGPAALALGQHAPPGLEPRRQTRRTSPVRGARRALLGRRLPARHRVARAGDAGQHDLEHGVVADACGAEGRRGRCACRNSRSSTRPSRRAEHVDGARGRVAERTAQRQQRRLAGSVRARSAPSARRPPHATIRRAADLGPARVTRTRETGKDRPRPSVTTW